MPLLHPLLRAPEGQASRPTSAYAQPARACSRAEALTPSAE
jgi:hypothetical protein